MGQIVIVRQTQVFRTWFEGLRDGLAQKRILVRIGRLERGNFGDVKPLGEGVSELRLAHGPGYRLYFARRGREVIILLCGGAKGSQQRDIRAAKQLARETE
jgi:putative addiction module killer protein